MNFFFTFFLLLFFIVVILLYPVFSDTADFFKAIQKGDMKLVEEYLSRGIKVDSVIENNKTALMIASLEDHLPIVKLRIDSGADVNKINDSKNTALHFAVLFFRPHSPSFSSRIRLQGIGFVST
ncbi:MAG: ankyrin repeat domain-containing protein [Spirochaetales bacterium]|nr:ankyrin repeat domain-containing protein [Spirochaetales bacterium]